MSVARYRLADRHGTEHGLEHLDFDDACAAAQRCARDTWISERRYDAHAMEHITVTAQRRRAAQRAHRRHRQRQPPDHFRRYAPVDDQGRPGIEEFDDLEAFAPGEGAFEVRYRLAKRALVPVAGREAPRQPRAMPRRPWRSYAALLALCVALAILSFTLGRLAAP